MKFAFRKKIRILGTSDLNFVTASTSIMRRRKPNPKVADLDEVIVNLFTKVPMAILRGLLNPWTYVVLLICVVGYFGFIFVFAFLFSYLPAKIYHYIGLGPGF